MPQPLISKLRLNVAYSQQATLGTLVYNGLPLRNDAHPPSQPSPPGSMLLHSSHMACEADFRSTCPLANAQPSLKHVMQ